VAPRHLRLTFEDDLAYLTLARPEVLNALSFSLLGEIQEAVQSVAVSSARSLLVTGDGDRAFCAGADVAELVGRPAEACQKGSELGQSVFQMLADLPIPSIALINGYAFGGGLELALACTFRLALRTAKLGFPEIKLGLIPGYGGTQRLARLVGSAPALEMVLTGDPITAEQAASIGLVNAVVDADLDAAGRTLARRLTRHSLVTFRLARAAVMRAAETSLAEGLRSETELSTLAYMTEDANEGMRAFLEKRPAHFRDR
jgi:enoyl-CoA hydratase